MRRLVLFAAVLGLTGCGEPTPPPMAGSPESSRTALVAALDGWKAGKTREELSSQPTPLYVVDDDLNLGAKLLDYQIADEPRPNGTGYSFVVTLSLQTDTGGKRPPKKVAYKVVTEPKIAVTREERQP